MCNSPYPFVSFTVNVYHTFTSTSTFLCSMPYVSHHYQSSTIHMIQNPPSYPSTNISYRTTLFPQIKDKTHDSIALTSIHLFHPTPVHVGCITSMSPPFKGTRTEPTQRWHMHSSH